ncbi:hypothetical protein EC396_10145 [Lutibacter sp. HS1-25]|uniref:hypothetical protein n=1 Tax=Lutibacter sp. HS1-25 TaxID=2485000 RepID=UPI0010134001|nr:hypothetical protein [Lutibacter sp. HS1-25]RXP53648.1 hypothetical protein EC396_10145 [Lutibacter sp. HS1-25]
MNKHQQLDLILKYMSENLDSIPRRPDSIIRRAKLNIDNTESYRMFIKMLSDGYVYEHINDNKKTLTFGISYNGIIFLADGGYSSYYSKNKLKNLALKISNITDIIIKPIGVFTAILISAWYIVKLLEFFGIIKSCVN